MKSPSCGPQPVKADKDAVGGEPTWEPPARTTSHARRTGTDRQVAIMPAPGPIRTTLNARQVSADLCRLVYELLPRRPLRSSGRKPCGPVRLATGDAVLDAGDRRWRARGVPDRTVISGEPRSLKDTSQGHSPAAPQVRPPDPQSLQAGGRVFLARSPSDPAASRRSDCGSV